MWGGKLKQLPAEMPWTLRVERWYLSYEAGMRSVWVYEWRHFEDDLKVKLRLEPVSFEREGL